jgi:hypothetical protein
MFSKILKYIGKFIDTTCGVTYIAAFTGPRKLVAWSIALAHERKLMGWGQFVISQE